MSDNKKKLSIETPIEAFTPEVTPQKTVAAGPKAVMNSMKHGLTEMGITRTVQVLSNLNQKQGFDCPSCAWPDPDDRRSLVEFCENGAKAVSDEATRKKVDADFFAQHSIAELSQMSDFELGKSGRICQPLIKKEGATHYSPISWEDAFEEMAKELLKLKSPNEASFYTSGRTSNEAAFAYQLFVRLLGTNNLPDCSNMCHESSGVALNDAIGVGKGTVKLHDFDLADCILVIGQNPGTNHPRMLTALERASRKGCKIISINPLMEPGLMNFKNPQEVGGWIGRGTPIATYFLPVKINGDVAVAKGLIKAMLELESQGGPGSVLDLDFIQQHTTGFEAFAADIREESWERIVLESGISEADIREVAEILSKSKATIACWAMGLTQQKNGVGNIQSYVNLLLLRGQLGKPGAGACPVRGHSNVQGDRTMGIYEKMPESFMAALDKEFKYSFVREHGADVVATLNGMYEGKIKVFLGLGGNFMYATPDTEYSAKALQNCELTVHVSTKLNRSHVVTGRKAMIWPCLGRTEIDEQKSGAQFVSVEDSMGVVHSSRGKLTPASTQLKSEVAIICGLARAVFKKESKKAQVVDWLAWENNYDAIREQISRVIPGFTDYNQQVRRLGGFYLPNAVRDQRKFNNSVGKAKFTVHPIPNNQLPQGHLHLMSLRSHDQFNTTIYGLDDRYRGITHGRRVIFLNTEDMVQLGLKAYDRVDIVSHFREEKRRAPQFIVVPYKIPRQCAAVYYPESNILVPIESVAERSNSPAYKCLDVTLEKVDTLK
jgi:molybdopterin-dependent oxidoreductase alpha subunit